MANESAKERKRIQDEINDALQSENNITQQYATLLQAQFKTQKKITNTIKDRAKVLGKLVDADDNQKDIAERVYSLQNKSKQISEKLANSRKKSGQFQKGFNAQTVKSLNLDKEAVETKLKGLKTQRNANFVLESADKLTGGMASKAKNLFGHVKKVGPGFAAAGFAVTGIVAGVALIVKSLRFVSDLTDKFGAKFGVIGAQSSEFQTSLMDASVEVISLGKGADDVAEVVGTLSSEFGIGLQNATNITEQILDTAVATGMATGEATKLFGTLMTIGNLTADQAEFLTESTYQLAAQNRVNPAAVMQDIAESAETIAKFGADNLDSISKAAVKARALGTNLSSIASAAEGFLDFQSSLTAEFEAEVLLGRNLELSRARQLALEGDLNGVLDEIVKNVGSEAELNKLNVIERRSLAKALNMDVQSLTKIVSLQDKSVVQQKQFADLAGEDGMSALTNILNTFKEIGASILKDLGEPMNNALIQIRDNFLTPENIEKIKEGLRSIVPIIETIASGIMSFVKGIYNVVAFFTGKPYFDQAFPSLAEIKAKSVMANDFKSSGGSHLILTPSGKMLQTNPRDTIVGSTRVNDFQSGPAGSMPIGNSEGLIKKLIEQNNTMITLLERNPKRIGDAILEGSR